MFIYVHLTQEKNWHLVKAAITTHTNSFSKQQEHKGMISPNDKMIVTSLLHQPNAKNLTKGIIKKENQIETNNSTFLIKDLKIQDIFKDKDGEEGNSVTDELIMEISQLLKLVIIVTARTVEL